MVMYTGCMHCGHVSHSNAIKCPACGKNKNQPDEVGSVTAFSRLDAITPKGEAAGRRFEEDLNNAVQAALDSGLTYGMILGSLHHQAWELHRRLEEAE